MRQFIFTVASLIFVLRSICSAAERIRVGYVAPSITQFLPWIASERGILAKYDLSAEIILITGSPRLVQSLIAGDVDFAFAGVTALMRARLRGAEVAILGTSTNVSSQKLMVGRNSKVRRVEDLKGAIIGVSQYGSEADTFTRNALAMAATIIGIPLALANLKLIPVSLVPLGKEILPADWPVRSDRVSA